MDITDLGPDYVRVLFALEKTEKDLILAEASRALLAGRSPADILADFVRENSSSNLIIDPHFVCPIGQGPTAREFAPRTFEPEDSPLFALRGFARRDASGGVTAD